MLMLQDKEISVIVLGGATRGSTGWGITPSGKVVKIPDNNPVEVIAELALLATKVSDLGLRGEIEGVLGKAIAQLNSR